MNPTYQVLSIAMSLQLPWRIRALSCLYEWITQVVRQKQASLEDVAIQNRRKYPDHGRGMGTVPQALLVHHIQSLPLFRMEIESTPHARLSILPGYI